MLSLRCTILLTFRRKDLQPRSDYWQPSTSLNCYSVNALASSSRMTLDQTDSQSLMLKATSSRLASPRHDSSIVEGSSRHAKQDEIPCMLPYIKASRTVPNDFHAAPSHKGNDFTNCTVDIGSVPKATLPTSMRPLPSRKAMLASNSDAIRIQSAYNASHEPGSFDSIKNIPPIPTTHSNSGMFLGTGFHLYLTAS